MIVPGRALTEAISRCPAVGLRQTFFRAVDYKHLTTLLRAVGSKKNGGRFNVRNKFEVLYLAGNPIAALFEIESVIKIGRQLRAVPLPPHLMLSIDVRLQKVLNLTDPVVRRKIGVTVEDLKHPWKPYVLDGDVAPTQYFGEVVRSAKYEAILAPSARLRGANNLAIFPDRLLRDSNYRIHEPGNLVNIYVSGK